MVVISKVNRVISYDDPHPEVHANNVFKEPNGFNKCCNVPY